MELVDTHAHLDDIQFDKTRSDIVEPAAKAGVVQIICIGTTAQSSRRCVEIAAAFPPVFAAVGIQPNYVAEIHEGDWQALSELATNAKVVAIGETGLDYFWDDTPISQQQAAFEQHLRLAQRLDLPFVVHLRESQQDSPTTACAQHILSVLQEQADNRPLRGVMHSYTGNREFAEEFLKLGLHISFAGMVTYKKSKELREVAAGIPSDRILIETDAPYLSPHPKRGERPNQPALIVHTAECLSQARDESLQEFVRITTENARRLFRLPDHGS